MALTYNQIKNLVITNTQPILKRASKLKELFLEILEFANSGQYGDLDLEYDPAETFGTAEAKKYVEYINRLWKAKQASFSGQAPPTDINVDQNFYWEVVSESEVSGIKAWQAGLFGSGLIVVDYQGQLYKLGDNVTRPFESTDFAAELANGSWEEYGGSSGDGVPDGTFTIYSSADVTLNPTKAINNNFRLNRSVDGLLEFDLTNVSEGNSGNIITFWSSITSELLIEQDSIIKISSDSFNWFRGLLASRVSISNVDGAGTGGRVKITTSTAHGLTTGDIAFIQDVVGTEEANGANKITVIDSTNFELDNIIFYNTYTSGGEASYATKSLNLGFSNNTYSLFSFIVEDGNVYLTGINEFV